MSTTTLPFAASDIHWHRIKQKTVRKFLTVNRLLSRADFVRVSHSCSLNPDVRAFHKHLKTFVVKKPLASVWRAYKTVGPVKTCCGSWLDFGLQYSRRKNEITYREDDHGDIEAGQIVILNLRLLWQWVSLAVGHEITEVNEKEKYIQMCYLEGGASRGMQYIRLSENADGDTLITHETFYKSSSDFRDKRLYPWLHGLVIAEFHRNVANRVE